MYHIYEVFGIRAWQTVYAMRRQLSIDSTNWFFKQKLQIIASKYFSKLFISMFQNISYWESKDWKAVLSSFHNSVFIFGIACLVLHITLWMLTVRSYSQLNCLPDPVFSLEKNPILPLLNIVLPLMSTSSSFSFHYALQHGLWTLSQKILRRGQTISVSVSWLGQGFVIFFNGW